MKCPSILAVTLVLACASHLAAQTGPILVGDATRDECRIALDMAKAAFESRSHDLGWPIFPPDGADASIVLSRKARDISGGDGVQADAGVFERVEVDRPRHKTDVLYWQRETSSGRRIAVLDSAFNWQGDWYYLFNLDGELTQADFLRDYDKSQKVGFRQPQGAPPLLTPALGDNRWDPPVILQTPQTKKLWMLDQGGPGNGLTPWVVSRMAPDGLDLPCQIDFSADGKVGLARLPAAVSRFAAYADQTLGPGTGEGTLQPTARLRHDVQRDWAVLSERPWALTDAPYNARGEVDAGLADWARAVPARARLYRKLMDSYDTAAEALTDFYVAQFSLGTGDARRFSAYAMDLMLRRHFVFHSEALGPRAAPVNPWPGDIR